MFKTKGIILFATFFVVFFSGCDNKPSSSNETMQNANVSYELEASKTAWLRNHLPNETLAYINIPTPWNYLFDAKADALHAVQSLPAHKQQVAAIKQGVKSHYFKLIPPELQDISRLLLEHMETSLEVALINDSPTAMLPTVAVGSRLQGISAADLAMKLAAVLKTADPSIELTPADSDSQWTFKVNMFPAFVQFDESSGKLLIYGGMGANEKKLTRLWEQAQTDQLTAINSLSQKSDPSGLNMKMWIAPARMYQLGGAFVPAEQHQMINQLGLDQMDYIWLGAESAQGQSALALHVMMPEAGWRLMLPRANEWFDVDVAGNPRSVIQMALPTAEQIEQAISHFKLGEMLSEKDRADMKDLFEFEQKYGFDIYDFFKAYYQQIYMVTDESGSWWAMKIKDNALHDKLNDKMYEFFDIKPESKTLRGIEIMQAHFSVYGKIFESAANQSEEMAQFNEFIKLFKDHAYWYVEDGIYYMSSVPQILADKRNSPHTTKLSAWLNNNQGDNWDSAILAYGKDVQNMPQSLYHFYLLMLQSLGDMAQAKVDLFELPTAKELNLPDSGRINLVLSSDAEKVSFKFGYEYSFAEGILTSESGFALTTMVAIMVAYAVPAYKDYTVRAKVGEQLALAAGMKVGVTEHYLTHNTFVGAQEGIVNPGVNFFLDDETGTIVIDMAAVDSIFNAGDDIYLEPVVEEGYIEWICISNIKEAYLPASCRF
ncbi:MAG: pilin [Marinicella sp.]